MSFQVHNNPEGVSSFERITVASTRLTGLLGVMQDREYISAYRTRSLQIEAQRNRSRSYLLHAKAYVHVLEKRQLMSELRTAQSTCFLVRAFKAVLRLLNGARTESVRPRLKLTSSTSS